LKPGKIDTKKSTVFPGSLRATHGSSAYVVSHRNWSIAAMVTTSPASSIAADAVLGRLLNEHEAAAFLGYTTRALQNWRLRGGGPVFVKVSDRSIRYRHRDLVAWIEARLRTSTTDPGPTPNIARGGAGTAPGFNSR
jgi:hypothetical protein